MVALRSDEPKGSMFKLMPAGPNTFRSVAEGFSSEEAGEVVTFDFGADGNTIGMRLGENYTSRLQ